jgi:hypothetical protein
MVKKGGYWNCTHSDQRCMDTFGNVPMILMGGFDQQQIQNDIQMSPQPTVRVARAPFSIRVPASGHEDIHEMVIESENSCDSHILMYVLLLILMIWIVVRLDIQILEL